MVLVKKGLDIPISGAPDQERIQSGNKVKKIALLGADYIGLKPKMHISEGDQVCAGQVLFSDKQVADIRITAPFSGKVTAINRGKKRILESVVIEKNSEEGLMFSAWDAADLATLTKDQVIEQMVVSGLWAALRTRPYSKIPDPKTTPHSIFVNAMDTRPLAADPVKIISEYSENFSNGLTVLRQLTEGTLYLCTAPDAEIPVGPCKKVCFKGPHPAGLSGTHIHFLDPVHLKKVVWYIGYQDVIAMGKLFTTGRLWSERVISIAGPQVQKPRLIRTDLGASLTELAVSEVKPGENRLISGSVLDGRATMERTAFLGRYHGQMSVLLEGVEREFLHYLRLGCKKFSVMPVYLSHFFKRKKFDFTTSTQGSLRAMVPVGSYEKVMPLDILPTQLLRALIVGDIEMAYNLGMLELDEEDIALCTFVCPGKYEYGPILRRNLTLMEKEG